MLNVIVKNLGGICKVYTIMSKTKWRVEDRIKHKTKDKFYLGKSLSV